jgi:hypothetical protein
MLNSVRKIIHEIFGLEYPILHNARWMYINKTETCHTKENLC